MPCEIKEKERLGSIDPIFTCQPCGAQYASIGVKDCIGIVHGGQGCVMFVRLLFAQHFKENFELASSSVHEAGAVFGAAGRLEEAVDVLLMRYPEVKVVPLISTCSTEVIGDDIEGVCRKLNETLLKEKYPGREVHLIPIHTPSFVGSMVSGYDEAVFRFVEHFAERGEPSGKLNVFTGWVNPGDVASLKSILRSMDVEATVFFETEPFDSPIMPDKSGKSRGGTSISDLQGSGSALASIALSRYEGAKAARHLQGEFGVPSVIVPTPIGFRNTDQFVKTVARLTGKPIPRALAEERGRALDALQDLTHMFFADKKVAIYGNPDLAIGLAQFCLDLEMRPVLLLLGDDNPGYAADPRLLEMKAKVDFDMLVVTNADLWELDGRLKRGEIELDLILGHSKGRFAAMDNHVPMTRVGFPTYDRAGLHRHPVLGYQGAVWLAEEMANTLFADMEHKGNKEWLLNVW